MTLSSWEESLEHRPGKRRQQRQQEGEEEDKVYYQGF